MKLSDDLQFVTESLPQLRDYLLSKELYWPLGAALPRLTPGALLLALARIEPVKPVEAQKARLQLDAARVQWRTAWEQKCAREMENRLRLWTNFLSDYRSAPEQNLDSYRNEVRLRVILQLLQPETPGFSALSALADLDALLKRSLLPGDFVWEKEIQPAFSQTSYWFLYGRLA